MPDLDILWQGPLGALCIYALVILLTRLNGLRTFSQMSGFDFAITVATGTVIATAAVQGPARLAQAALALVSLIILQRIVAWVRLHTRWGSMVDNEPLLLVRGDRLLQANLRKSRITSDDLQSHLRRAGVRRLDDVEAVILETTGQFSVIKKGEGDFDTRLLEGVRG